MDTLRRVFGMGGDDEPPGPHRDASDPQWLGGYGDQSTDELIALEGPYRTDSIVSAFEQAIARKASRLGEEQLTDAERIVLAVEAMERDLNSDGFDGFFTNNAGLVPGLVDALQAIGADGAAGLARRAIATLGIDGPVTPEAVRSAMDRDDAGRGDALEQVDQAYYGAKIDLAPQLMAFIRAHRDEIRLP
jgi:hypothetical protein